MSEIQSSHASNDYEDSLTQEIRFAVVFYGGVSLCIYMGGVAQELLSLVRSTADLDPGEPLKPTEGIYRELGRFLYAARDSETPTTRAQQVTDALGGKVDKNVRTRFVVDILTGSSAGGINAVALAKALALRLPNLDALIDAWRRKADLDELLNDRPGIGKKTESLLNGDKMFDMTYEILRDMSEQKPTRIAGGAGLADEIDLFITATDLNGLYSPIRLADKYLEERTFKTVFRFRYRDPWVKQQLGLTTTTPLSAPVDQFQKQYDPILAFAARCTSSFPVAFPPMVWPQEYKLKDDYRNIFRVYTDASADGQNRQDVGLEQRCFGDGGALDPRPFSYAIEQIRFRTARRPTKRKLLFVDPFPERVDPEHIKKPRQLNFLQNLFLQATGLPRHDSIRGEIEAVNASNRLQDRLDALWEKVKRNPAQPPSPAYHHLRVSETTDAIAKLMARVARFDPESDESFFIRQIARAWRKRDYKDHLGEKKFLRIFDVDFQLRRLNFVASALDKRLQRPETQAQISTQADRSRLLGARVRVESALQYVREALRDPGSRYPLPDQAIKALSGGVNRQKFICLITQPDLKKREEFATVFINETDHRERVNEIVRWLNSYFIGIKRDFSRNYFDLTCSLRQLGPSVYDACQDFERWDEIALPLLEGTGVREFTRADVYCIGPAENDPRFAPAWFDSTNLSLAAKLKGTQFMDFGAFMSRDWRRNDLMWGRLDAVEKIVKALLPVEREEDEKQRHDLVSLQNHYIDRLRNAILREELNTNYFSQWASDRLQSTKKEVTKFLQSLPAVEDAIAGRKGKSLATFVTEHYDEPRPPAPKDYAAWVGRGLTILGRMIEDLEVGPVRRPALWLRTAGTTIVQAVRFSMPNTFRSVIFRNWAWVLFAGAVPLALAGALFSPMLAWWGLGVGLAGLVLVWAQNAASTWLAGKGAPLFVRAAGRFAAGVLLLMVLVLSIFGGVATSRCVNGGAACGVLACLRGEPEAKDPQQP